MYYRVTSGMVEPADSSTARPVIAAVSGMTLSIRSFIITSDAAQNVTIEDTAGTNIMPAIACEANRSVVSPVYAPGSYRVTGGVGINILGSTTDAVSAVIEAYVL